MSAVVSDVCVVPVNGKESDDGKRNGTRGGFETSTSGEPSTSRDNQNMAQIDGNSNYNTNHDNTTINNNHSSSGEQSIAAWRAEQRRENGVLSHGIEKLRNDMKTESQIESGLRYRGRHLNVNARNELVKYYKSQSEVLSTFDEVDLLLTERENMLDTQGKHTRSNVSDSMKDIDSEAAIINIDMELEFETRNAKLMMRMSYFVNIALFTIKTIAYFSSGSISILASALDSFLDIVAGSVLFLTSLRTKNVNKYTFPIGNNRMQPLGIIVFSSIMGTVGFQVLVEAMRQIFGTEHTHHLEDLYLIVGIMASVMIVKFGLWIFCRNSKDQAVQTYAQDHINDVFTNSVGLAGALLGDKVLWWLDPLAASLLSLYIVRCWTLTCIENFKAMLGLGASATYIQKLTYLCCHYHPKILKVDTVRAYTFGKQLFVEVDIVLPHDMLLPESHDIGESLQVKIEELPEVERAFVHIDYETTHRPDYEHGSSYNRLQKVN